MDHSLVATLGYAAVLAGCVIEGESVLIAAGLAALGGYLSLPLVVLFAWLGAASGDHFFFILGRCKGRLITGLRPSWGGRIEKALRLVERHGNLLIFGCRFLCGFRAIGPFAIGTARVGIGRFVLLNLFSSLVWASLFGSLSYYSGAAIRPFVADIRFPLIALLFVLACVALVVVRRSSGLGRASRALRATSLRPGLAGRLTRIFGLSQGHRA